MGVTKNAQKTKNLRSDPEGRSHMRIQAKLLFLDEPRYTEIGYFAPVSVVDKDVFRFEVSLEDVVVVDMFEALGDVEREF